MSQSEIWDEFEKLAITQGLVSVGEDDETYDADAQVSRAKSRADSLSDDAVRLLYGLKPESIYDTKKTMIEVAHPDTVVIAPAYDAMNSVIENEHQRQNITTYIAQKTPNGQLTQRRYVAARKDLVNSLVKAAFMLDNRDELELMSFADSCAVRVDQRSEQVIKKNAVAPAAAPLLFNPYVMGAGAIAGVLGIAYYFMYGATTAQNVYANSQKVIDALQPLRSEKYAAAIAEDVGHLMIMAEQVYSIKDELSEVTSVDAAVDVSKQAAKSAKTEQIVKKINEYISQLNKIARAIPGWVSAIKLAHSTTTEVKSDFWAKLTGIGSYFSWEKWQILIDALAGENNWLGGGQTGGLLGAIQKEIELMNATKAAAHQAVQNHPEVQEAQSQATQQTPVS